MIPFFFFGFFDSSAEAPPEDIKTSAKVSHSFVKKSFNLIKRSIESTQYVDDSLAELPKSKKKKSVKTANGITYKHTPYSNEFVSAIENAHLRTSKLLTDISEKSKADSDNKKLKEKQEQERKEKEAAELEAKRLQDEEDESILMLMFQMM